MAQMSAQDHLYKKRLFEKAQRHNDFVHLLKRFLIGALFLIFFGFMAFLFVPKPSFQGLDLLDVRLSGDALTMSSPKINGYDDENRPYEISAKQATQSLRNTDEVILDDLEASLLLEDDGWVRLESPKGVLNTKKRLLQLSERVSMTSSKRYQAELEDVFVDLARGSLKTENAVFLQGVEGSIKAESLAIFDKGHHLHFKGNVKLILYPQKKESSSL